MNVYCKTALAVLLSSGAFGQMAVTKIKQTSPQSYTVTLKSKGSDDYVAIGLRGVAQDKDGEVSAGSWMWDREDVPLGDTLEATFETPRPSYSLKVQVVLTINTRQQEWDKDQNLFDSVMVDRRGRYQGAQTILPVVTASATAAQLKSSLEAYKPHSNGDLQYANHIVNRIRNQEWAQKNTAESQWLVALSYEVAGDINRFGNQLNLEVTHEDGPANSASCSTLSFTLKDATFGPDVSNSTGHTTGNHSITGWAETRSDYTGGEGNANCSTTCTRRPKGWAIGLSLGPDSSWINAETGQITAPMGTHEFTHASITSTAQAYGAVTTPTAYMGGAVGWCLVKGSCGFAATVSSNGVVTATGGDIVELAAAAGSTGMCLSKPDPFYDAGGCEPLVVDYSPYGANGFSLTSPSAGKLFDWNGQGQVLQTSWVQNGTMFLALPNSDGTITNGHQLFGPGVKGGGFAALAKYDSNGDGVIDSLDPAFHRLVLWNGTSSIPYSTTVGDPIPLAAEAWNYTDQYGNWFSDRSPLSGDQLHRKIADATLRLLDPNQLVGVGGGCGY